MASNVSINIVESDSQIENMILHALVKEANKILTNVKNKVVSNVKPVIRTALENSPAIESLRSGVLKIDFGLTKDSTPAIIDTIVNSVDARTVRFSVVGSSIKGGLTLTVQPTDYSLLTTNPAIGGQVIKGGVMPWLDWMLVAGDAIIVANFGVEYWYTDSFVLRAGYIYDQEGKIMNPTFGAGIRFGQYGFDFGYTAGDQDHARANTMFFSVSMEL